LFIDSIVVACRLVSYLQTIYSFDCSTFSQLLASRFPLRCAFALLFFFFLLVRVLIFPIFFLLWPRRRLFILCPFDLKAHRYPIYRFVAGIPSRIVQDRSIIRTAWKAYRAFGYLLILGALGM
jgi:hypothetical protein